ncbi:hypothetical protein H634G_01473 [Metarhizium anisopliae BRIP 53293]|uniref:Acyltransferase MbtK/IucB-like conserved domain-containing protein n=1 Tax=Metarhizium anisopliae BRIP 53293 TaxID=1291518 RepID=A0A0D9PAS3_METAN|nr:hypothetical protein H634G_01473 [Metarhizium anisopliae BRIP 53293]KJK90999.1 hypothetical protein H633G_05132 [Metarhizium anisopliae BRIP 53284]
MAAANSVVQLSALSPNETFIKLPHPYLTEYTVQKTTAPPNKTAGDVPFYQLCERPGSSTQKLPAPLHNTKLYFSEPADLKSSELPADSNNGAWARARRSPFSVVVWDGAETPSLAQAWLLLYVLFTARPGMESVRLELVGANAATLGAQLRDVLLAVDHPPPAREKRASASSNADEYLHTVTITSAGDPQDADRCQQSWHPIRPAKPAPGAVVYSRWIPHLGETFSMVSLDYQDEEHLRLFHEWQNDPRVSQGWNETGTLDQHREYLRNIHEDPHQVAVLAKWDDAYFAYFEVYWAKEDRLGGYYDAGDFDRGRHSLVGDVRFRGPHRVTAWWSSLMHYLFLDDPRTMHVVGEPKNTNATVVMYDLIHGFGIEHFVDLPHKRSAFVRCPRNRFFQLCPLGENDKAVGGMRIGLVPKL